MQHAVFQGENAVLQVNRLNKVRLNANGLPVHAFM